MIIRNEKATDIAAVTEVTIAAFRDRASGKCFSIKVCHC